MGPVWAVVCLVALFPRAAATGAPPRHVRGATPFAQKLLESTVRRSPTAAGLAGRIDASDLIVYVQVTPLEHRRSAQTVLLTTAGAFRYVLISIHHENMRARMMELLGHELQHAVEIAEARDVRDRAGMVRLYRRIGSRSGVSSTFETDLAQVVGVRVGREIAFGALDRP